MRFFSLLLFVSLSFLSLCDRDYQLPEQLPRAKTRPSSGEFAQFDYLLFEAELLRVIVKVINSEYFIISVARLKSSTSHFASKEAFVEEMREFVNSFYSELSIKINASKEKNKQAIEKIKERVGKKLGGSAKSSKIPGLVIKNPAYSSSSAENSFDLKRKLIRPSSTKSLLDQTQQWNSPNSAALNRVEVLLRSKSSSNDHRKRGMGCETTLHNSKAKKSYTKPRKLNVAKQLKSCVLSIGEREHEPRNFKTGNIYDGDITPMHLQNHPKKSAFEFPKCFYKYIFVKKPFSELLSLYFSA